MTRSQIIQVRVIRGQLLFLSSIVTLKFQFPIDLLTVVRSVQLPVPGDEAENRGAKVVRSIESRSNVIPTHRSAKDRHAVHSIRMVHAFDNRVRTAIEEALKVGNIVGHNAASDFRQLEAHVRDGLQVRSGQV